MTLPSAMRAITINSNKAKVTEVPLPQLRPTYLLAKVEAIALNRLVPRSRSFGAVLHTDRTAVGATLPPKVTVHGVHSTDVVSTEDSVNDTPATDWKHVHYQIAAPGGISGCDFAGTVVEVGSEVSKSLKAGDRIAATTHGANFSQPEDGCFAEYALAKADLVVRIPDSLSFEKAATFPLGVATVGQGLFQQALKLKLPTEPTEHNEPVLIYGGSSATGSLGIQFAKLAGYRVLTTCSPHNNDFVKSLGADAVYDYKDPKCGAKINEATDDSLKLIWDTISVDTSAKICAEAMGSDTDGAKYGVILEEVNFPRDGVEAKDTFMYSIFNEAFEKGGEQVPAFPEDFEFAKKFFSITEGLLADGKLKTHPEQVGKDGLAGVLKGFVDMKNNKVSGKKLVYRVVDTPAGSNAEVEL